MNDEARKNVSRISPRDVRLHPDSPDPRARRPIAPTEIEDEAPPAEPVAMATAYVAQGRTLSVPNASGKRRVVGYERETGRDVRAIIAEVVGPGARVELPAPEVDRLVSLGFLRRDPLPPAPAPDAPETVNAIRPGRVSGVSRA